jgi:hypothetical protein
VGTITAVTARVQIQGVTGSSVYTTEGLAVAVGGNTVNPNGRGVVADFSAGGISDPATTYGVTINLGASSVGQWGIRIVPGGAFAISDYYPGGSYVGASNPPTERLRIDSSGRLLVGTSTPIASDASIFQVAGGDGARPRFHRNINDNYESAIRLSKARGTGFEIVSNNDDIGVISFQGANGSALNECASIKGSIDGSTISSTSMPGRLVFSTTADGAASPTERMRITSRGDLLLGSTPPSANARFTLNVAATGNNAIAVRDIANTADHWTLYIGANATTGGWNGAATINYCSRDTGTGRSINAAGTINASGADYAEYMVKAGEFEIAKGDVCGVTADGKLTNVFADAVGFLVKSTNPSYVGGDIWGTEDAIGAKPGGDEPELLAEWEATLEAERQKFDRIAFAGQVPVNVIGATPGQYVVPVATEDGGIVGVAKNKSEMTPAEYMDSVGKVIAIEDDGRARIIVKVA